MREDTLTSELLSMDVGEKKEYPAMRINSLRSLASTLGFRFDRKYTTCIDKKKRAVCIKRLK